MVELVNLTKSFKSKTVFEKINYHFKNKEVYLISGESGVGKTTLLNLISKRISPDSGKVNVGGDCLFLSINDCLVEELTVKENIDLYLEMFEGEKVDDCLEIRNLLDLRVSKLSVGERVRVKFYLLLMIKAKVVLLDEPFAGLDEKYLKKCIKIIRECGKNRLIIIVSHIDPKIKSWVRLSLKEGKLIDLESKNEDKSVVEDCSFNKRIDGLKWGIVLHKKQLLSRIVFLMMILSLAFSGGIFKKELFQIKSEVEAFGDGKKQIVYKEENSLRLNEENFYNLIVSSLAFEIHDYSYNKYSYQMYEGEVSVDGKYLDNGFLIADSLVDQGLKDDEVSLVINTKDFCVNNQFKSCLFKQVKEELLGRNLRYSFDNLERRLIIKEVNEGENNFLILGSEKVKNSLIDLHSVDYVSYVISINKDKLEEFYLKLNEVDSLLHFDFNFLKEDNECVYFLVSESEYSYFKERELSDKLIACSDVGVSCNFFDYKYFTSLSYIDDLEVANNIQYDKYFRSLEYKEIAISLGLSKKLDKQVDEEIDLRFYFDQSFYVLERVKIVDIIPDENLVIYHNKYDYRLFVEKFNKLLRVSHAIDPMGNIGNYKNSNLLYSDLLLEAKLYLENLVHISNIVFYVIEGLMIGVLFLIEGYKFRKHWEFIRVVAFNKVSLRGLMNSYFSLYLMAVIFLIKDLLLVGIYCFIYFGFYCLLKRKIKSRYPGFSVIHRLLY